MALTALFSIGGTWFSITVPNSAWKPFIGTAIWLAVVFFAYLFLESELDWLKRFRQRTNQSLMLVIAFLVFGFLGVFLFRVFVTQSTPQKNEEKNEAIINVPLLKGAIDALSTGEGLAVAGVARDKAKYTAFVQIVMTVSNTGIESVANDYQLSVVFKDGRSTKGQPISFLNEVKLVHEDSGVPETLYPEDMLATKTLQPIIKGGLAQGRLFFTVPETSLSELRTKGNIFRVEFKDLWGKTYRCEMTYEKDEDVLLRFPGMRSQQPLTIATPPTPSKLEMQVAEISKGLNDLRNDLLKSNTVNDEARLSLLHRQAEEATKQQEALSKQQRETLQRDTLSIESLEKARQLGLQQKEARRQKEEFAKQEQDLNRQKQQRLDEQQIDEREKKFATYFVDSADYAIASLYDMLKSISSEPITTDFPDKDRPTIHNSELFKDGRFRNGKHFIRLGSHKEWEFQITTSGNPPEMFTYPIHKYFGFQIRTPTATMLIGNQYFQMGTWQLDKGDLKISCQASDNSELYSQRCSYTEYQKPVHEALRALIQTCWDALPLTTTTQPSPTPNTGASQH